MVISELRRQISRAVLAGLNIDQIEHEIIDPAPIAEDEKAALWLYGQALSDRPREREFALLGSG